MLAGVYIAKKKDNSTYYRSSLTYRNKHISLGSFPTELQAHKAYLCALALLESDIAVDEAIQNTQLLSFDKVVMLINFRDNCMYIPTPIYLRKNYFSYYLEAGRELKFDIDDLFYYSSHKILRRQGHLYVNDYGMQITLLSRYGIKSHAVRDRDYCFVNGDTNDFRYSNIEVINPYFGVTRFIKNGIFRYRVRIHNDVPLRIAGRSSDGLDQRGGGTKEPFLVCVQNSNQCNFRYIQPLPQEIDSHQDVKHIQTHIPDDFCSFQCVNIGMEIIDPDSGLLHVPCQIFRHPFR